MGSQGMGDPSGLLAGIPPGLQGLPPQLAAQLMQVRRNLSVAICVFFTCLHPAFLWLSCLQRDQYSQPDYRRWVH